MPLHSGFHNYFNMAGTLIPIPTSKHPLPFNVKASLQSTLLAVLLLTCFGAKAQVGFTESFETDSAATYFGENGQQFLLVNKLRIHVEDSAISSTLGRGVGAAGIGRSNRFINNHCTGCNTPNTSYITTPGAAAFRLSSFYFYASSMPAGDTPTSGGSIIFSGKLNGTTVFKLYKSNGWPVSFATFNGFSFFDFASCNTWTDSSTQNNVTSISIDSLEIELLGGFAYEAIDLFTWRKSPPVVTTVVPSLIGGTSAILNGNVSNSGSSAVSERGFVYSTTPGLLSGTRLSCGAGTGLFNDTAGPLLPNTTYYYRAYGINAQDTSYGAELSFTTRAILSSGIDSTNVTCNGKANGTASVTPTGGCPPYFYLWSPGAQTTSSITNIGPGVYTCTITDTLGMQIQKTTSITEPPAFSNNIITNTAQYICYGGATVPLTAGSPSGGGAGGYTYKWISSVTGPLNGFAAASGVNDTAGYAPGVRTQTTWFRRIVRTTNCADTSAAVAVWVTPAVYNNTFSILPSAVCAGSPTSIQLWGSTPMGGTGSYIYSWESSITSATTGFTPLSGSGIYYSGIQTLSQNTWYRRKITSGVCSSTSSGELLPVNPVLNNNTISSANQQICSGTSGASITAAIPSGGNGTYTYNWLSSTTSATGGFANASGTRTGQNYTPGVRTQPTWFKRLVSSGGCTDTSGVLHIDVVPKVTNNLSGNQTHCARMAASFTEPAPTGGNGPYTFLWISSATGNATDYAAAPGVNSGQSYNTGPLTASTWYKRIVYSGVCTDTSQARKITIDNTDTWNGNISADWSNPSNWSCGYIPDSTNDVIIYSFSPYSPVVSNTQVCRDLTIAPNGRLTLNNPNSSLHIYGNFSTNIGTDTPLKQMAGVIVFKGASIQTMPHASYSKVVIDNPAGVKLNYNVKVTDSVKFVQGNIFLNDYEFWLSGTQSRFINAASDRHVVCDGSSFVKLSNLGIGGRTGNIEIPLGTSASSYSPITLSNAGTADNFYFRVKDSVYQGAYPGAAPALTQNAINCSWMVYEDVPGGSNLTTKLQWSATQELPGFNRSAAYVTYYRASTGGPWNPGPVAASSGTGPYNLTRSGITVFDDFVLTVASGGTLPVNLLRFDATLNTKDVLLSWSTASEINNSHFIVQRSTDQKTYTDLAAFEGKGSTQTISYYNYTDESAYRFSATNNAPVIYYRLKQVDLDGKVSFSPVRPVSFNSMKTDGITAYPNPFHDNTLIRISGTRADEKITYHLTDISGRLISAGNIKSVDTETFFDITSLSQDLAGGTFFLVVQHGTQRQILKITKLK